MSERASFLFEVIGRMVAYAYVVFGTVVTWHTESVWIGVATFPAYLAMGWIVAVAFLPEPRRGVAR